MILAGLLAVFLLLAGVYSMESDDDSEKTGALKRRLHQRIEFQPRGSPIVHDT